MKKKLLDSMDWRVKRITKNLKKTKKDAPKYI